MTPAERLKDFEAMPGDILKGTLPEGWVPQVTVWMKITAIGKEKVVVIHREKKGNSVIWNPANEVFWEPGDWDWVIAPGTEHLQLIEEKRKATA